MTAPPDNVTPPVEGGNLRQRRPHRFLRAALAILAGLIGVGWVQSRAGAGDYQNAFMATSVIALLAIGTVIYQATRAAAARGWRWLVPGLVTATLVTAAALLRFEHFSGEMVPQFGWRFGQPAPPALQTAAKQPAEIASSDEGKATAPPWPGLLGPNRNGVLAERSFMVPTSAADVSTRWSIGVGEGWGSFAVGGGLAVTLEQRGDREAVTAYDLATGQLRWLVDHAARHENALGGIGPRSTPAIDGDRVYAQGATGHVWCIDLATGRSVWTVDLLKLAGWSQLESEAAIPWGRAGSPLIVQGLCVIPYGHPDETTDRSLIALDAGDGSVRWTAGREQISYASPARMTLADVDQIVSVNEATITGHAIGDGTVLWSTPFEGQSNGGANCAAAVPAGEDRFLIGKGYSGGSAVIQILADEDGTLRPKEIWSSTRVLKTKFNHAAVVGRTAYGLSNGTLEAVGIEDGRRTWRQSRGERFGQGQVIAAGDCLVIQAEEGDVAFVDADPAEYRVRMSLPALASKTWNIPTLAGRMLLVRNDRRAIAFELPPRTP